MNAGSTRNTVEGPTPITIDEIDNLVTQEEIILENIEPFNIEVENVLSLRANSHDIRSIKKKKKVWADEEISKLKEGIDNIANAIRETSLHMVQDNILPIIESELWITLQDLELHDNTLSTA